MTPPERALESDSSTPAQANDDCIVKLKAENAELREQVRRLLAAENKLLVLQDHLSTQQRIHVRLAEAGRKLNSLREVDEILATAVEFAVYTLGYERCAAFLKDSTETNAVYRAKAHEGYYEDEASARIENVVLSGDEPGLCGIDLDPGFVCHGGGDYDQATRALGDLFLVDEYFVFALNRDNGALLGFLVAGNTSEQSRYQTEIRRDGEMLVALSNLASQVGTAINQVRSYRALERERALLDQTVADRTRELSDALDTAHQAVRIKAEFLANVSHELRTPLNSIVNVPIALLRDYAEAALYRCTKCDAQFQSEDGEPTPLCPDCGSVLLAETQLCCVGDATEHKSFLELLRRQGVHLLELVNDILDFSRIEAGKLELHVTTVDIAELLAEVKATLETAHPERSDTIGIPLELSDLEIVADPLRLKEILLNLLGNAIKFTPPGKEIRVRVADCKRDAPGVSFVVEDEGIGIPEDQLEGIFESFRQVDGSHTRAHGGSGLGLAITRHLVEMHGGQVTVTSQLGQGSCFTVWLPREQRLFVSPPSVVPATTSGGAELQKVGFGRVVVVDDEPAQLSVARKLLENEGYSVELVSGSGQAFETIRRIMPRFVLLDIMMPVENGFTVLAQLRRDDATRSIPVFVSTAFHYNKKQARELGAFWLPKPLNSRALSAANLEAQLEQPSHASRVSSDDEQQQHRVTRVGQSVKRILYVEDEDANWEVTRLSLRGKYQLVRARDSRDTFEHIAAGGFDLVLLDMQLKGSELSGMQICEALTGRFKGELPGYARGVVATCPIVFVTAYCAMYARDDLLASGASELVTKPVDFAQLLMVVSRLLVKGALNRVRED